MLPSMPTLTPNKDETKRYSSRSPELPLPVETPKQIENDIKPVIPLAVQSSIPIPACNFATSTSEKVVKEEKVICEESDDNEDAIDWKKINKTPKSKLKRKERTLKECKTTYDLLTSENELNDDTNYATSYYELVSERLNAQNPDDFTTFYNTVLSINDGVDPADVYKELEKLFLPNHSDLLEQFLGFLSPKQACKVGKFMEYFFITNMDKFGQMFHTYFSNQPSQMKKFYTALEELSNDPNVSIDKVKLALLPLIKTNKLLLEWFLQLFPTEKPHQYDLTDFERLDFDKFEADDMFDKIIIPEENDDPYGGDNCICHCHNSDNVKYKSRYLHCIPCGMKYIQGRVFVQTGKRLRPVTVTFDGPVSIKDHITRLSAKPKPIKRRADSSPTKNSLSPNKSNSSEEPRSEHATDTDEDSKRSPKKNFKLQSKCKNKQAKEGPKNTKIVLIKENEVLTKDKENKNIAISNDAPNVVSIKPKLYIEKLPDPIESRSDDEVKPEIANCLQVMIPKDEVNTLESEDKMSSISLGSCSDASICSDSDVSVHSEKSDVINSDSEDMPIEDTEDNTNDSEEANSLSSLSPNKVHKSDSSSDQTTDCLLSNPSSATVSSESVQINADNAPWTREEDKIVLQTFQAEPDFDSTLAKICEQLPHKNISDVKNRFKILLNLLQKISFQK